MTESNFATSSARAASNIVLTASTILVCSVVGSFCWALAVEILAENMNAKAIAAGIIRSGDDMHVSLIFPWLMDQLIRTKDCVTSPRSTQGTSSVPKDEAQASESRSGLRTSVRLRVDYWSLPTVSSVETGLR